MESLIPEAVDACVGSYGQMGHGTDDNCINQEDAANFIRYATKSELDDPNMALVVTLPQDGVVNLYGRRSDGVWVHWPTVIFDQGDRRIILAGSRNLTELDFRDGTQKQGFGVDNISITAQ